MRDLALLAATSAWHVFPQESGGLGTRLAGAHEAVASTGLKPVVQVGMDTPQLTPSALRDVAAKAQPGTAVLGPAHDGGWWTLALVGDRGVRSLIDVPMSASNTHELTREALLRAGLRVRSAPILRDVDTAADAAAVAECAPGTRFAARWRQARGAA